MTHDIKVKGVCESYTTKTIQVVTKCHLYDNMSMRSHSMKEVVKLKPYLVFLDESACIQG